MIESQIKNEKQTLAVLLKLLCLRGFKSKKSSMRMKINIIFWKCMLSKNAVKAAVQNNISAYCSFNLTVKQIKVWVKPYCQTGKVWNDLLGDPLDLD